MKHPPFETLVALWSGDLPEAEAAEVDEHLFACDACAATSHRLCGLVAGLREVIPPVISHARRDRMAASGTRIRLTTCVAGGKATAVFGREVDLLVHALRADLSGAEQVDLEVVGTDGVRLVSLEHVPFDPASGEVLIACQRHYQALHAGDSQPIFRLHVVEGGTRRHLADYLVHHIWE